MTSFSELSRSDQLRRIRPVARTALTGYDLGPVRFTAIQHWLNTTYEVRAASGRYVLRVHRPGIQDAATIRSELLWLAALRRDTDLVVPEPVATRDGELVQTVAVEELSEARHCVLFRWVEGHFLSRRLTWRPLRQAGAFLARLHQHAERWGPPTGFTRPRWDAPALLSESIGIDLRASQARLEPDQRAVIDAATEYVATEMATLDADPAAFGLIHADFHEGNYLFHQGQVRAIDFDNCGWGYYLYDIAVAYSTLIGRFPDRYPAMRAAFLQGYLLTRPIDLPPARREALLAMFLVARIRAHTLWQAGLLDNPVFRARAPARIARQVGIIRDLLQQVGK